jgi:hypothetical protein
MTKEQLKDLNAVKNNLQIGRNLQSSYFIALAKDYLRDRSLIKILTNDKVVNIYLSCFSNESEEEVIKRLDKEFSNINSSFSKEELIGMLLYLSNRTSQFKIATLLTTPKNSGIAAKRLKIIPKILKTGISVILFFILMLLLFTNTCRKSVIENSDFTLREVCDVYDGKIVKNGNTINCKLYISIEDENNLRIIVKTLPYYDEYINELGYINRNSLKIGSVIKLDLKRDKQRISLNGENKDETWSFYK